MSRIQNCDGLTKFSEPFARPDLSQLQWQVIMIAIQEAGRARRISDFEKRIYSVLGFREKWRACKPLANDDLEALRQFVCLCRIDDEAACDLVPRLLAAGFSHMDVSAIAHIAQRP